MSTSAGVPLLPTLFQDAPARAERAMMTLRDDHGAEITYVGAVPEIETRATRLLGIRLPIVQGGLARVAFAELAAAVSNAGGLGQISTVGLGGTPERLREEIRRCRALTDKPFGVNFPIGR